MPDLKPEENKLIFAQHDRQRDGNIDYFIWDLHEFRDSIRKDSIRWCYLDDLIAQADKAERLQKAVDYALQVLDNLTEIGGVDLQIIKIKQMIKE